MFKQFHYEKMTTVTLKLSVEQIQTALTESGVSLTPDLTALAKHLTTSLEVKEKKVIAALKEFFSCTALVSTSVAGVPSEGDFSNQKDIKGDGTDSSESETQKAAAALSAKKGKAAPTKSKLVESSKLPSDAEDSSEEKVPVPTKKGRPAPVKAADSSEDEAAPANVKGCKAAKLADSSDDEAAAPPVAPVAPVKAKGKPAAKVEDSSDDDAALPVAAPVKAATKGKPAPKVEDSSDDEAAAPAKTKGKPAPKVEDSSDEEPAVPVAPVKAKGKPAPKVEDSSDDDAAPPAAKSKPAAKAVAAVTDSDDEAPATKAKGKAAKTPAKSKKDELSSESSDGGKKKAPQPSHPAQHPSKSIDESDQEEPPVKVDKTSPKKVVATDLVVVNKCAGGKEWETPPTHYTFAQKTNLLVYNDVVVGGWCKSGIRKLTKRDVESCEAKGWNAEILDVEKVQKKMEKLAV